MKFISGATALRSLAIVLCASVAISPTLEAQSFEVALSSPGGFTGQSAKAPSRSAQGRLTVFVLQGDRGVNFIPDHRGTTPVVEVRDQNGAPIEGADVIFTLPATGPSGLFSNGQRTATVRTNSDGQAAIPFSVNQEAGKFEIQVTATYGGQTGSAVITQTNSLRAAEQAGKSAARPWYHTWKLWALLGVAGGATAAAVLATRGGSSPSITTITITPGAPSVGHP